MKIQLRNTTSVIILLITAFTGCGQLGTGVVLWPPADSVWEPGDIITIHDESFLRKTYIVNLPKQRKLKEEIDQWRLRIFRRKQEALSWANSITEWKDVYAECLSQGLPMRLEPTNLATQVYRFREGDRIKVLGREPGPVQVGNLEGFWYKVLAYGGIEGYVFDYHLNVIKINGKEEVILNKKDTRDSQLDHFLAQLWRPSYFDTMITRGQIDQTTFRPEYGLFIDRKSQTLRLHLPDKSLKEVWTDIVRVGPNRYDFLDTSFRATINSDTFVSVQYNIDGIEYYEAFVRPRQRVSDIIKEENNRQSEILVELMNNGPTYGSRSYGTLEIIEKGRFSWSGKSSLISQGLLTLEAGNSGNIKLHLFLDSSIAQAHEGIISFQFDNSEVLNVLYAFEKEGLRFLYVPENAINDGIVLTDQYLAPLHIFFKKITSETVKESKDIPVPQ